jgi:hypothetical protein
MPREKDEWFIYKVSHKTLGTSLHTSLQDIAIKYNITLKEVKEKRKI